MKTPEARRLIIEHLESWTNVKGEYTGKDLQAMGLKGKEIGDTLNAIKLAIIDEEIKTHEDEINYVNEKILHS